MQKVLWLGAGDLSGRFHAQLPVNTIEFLGVRRNPSKMSPYHTFAADIRDEQQLMQLLQQQTHWHAIVLTCTPAAMTDAGYRTGYVDTVQALTAAIAASGVTVNRVVFVSSTGVYGQNRGERVDEHSSTCPANFRGARMLEAEQWLQHSGLPVTILRCSGLYTKPSPRLLQHLREGALKVPKQQYSNRIHRDDVAGALAYWLTQPQHTWQDCYVMSDSEPVLMDVIYRQLALRAGLSYQPLTASEREQVVGKRCDNRRLLASGYRLCYPSYRQGYRACWPQRLMADG